MNLQKYLTWSTDSTLKIGIMKLNLFPHLDCLQLISDGDRFVPNDDVNYRKQGFIDRNNTLVDGAPTRFTLPIMHA